MESRNDVLYQLSLLHALMAADYETAGSVQDVLAHCDTGLGTCQ